MDEERRRTLETLIGFAARQDPGACWDPERAVAILRTQSTRAELEALGAPAEVLHEIWPEEEP